MNIYLFRQDVHFTTFYHLTADIQGYCGSKVAQRWLKSGSI